jgi:hypothetical protein
MKNERAVGNPPSIPSSDDVCRVLTHNLRSEAAKYARWALLVMSDADRSIVDEMLRNADRRRPR